MRKAWLIYLLFLSIVIGAGYNTYLHYDFSHTIDTKTYLSIAEGNFKDQSLTRRYRVLVPFTAKLIALPLQKVYAKVWPHRAQTEWPLRLAFYILNSLLVALAGIFVYRTCLAYSISPIYALIATLALLSSRWCNYTAGLPMTDSLYFLVLTLTLYGIKAKDKVATFVALILGFWAKESYLLMLPILVLFGPIKWWKSLLIFALSFGIALLVRKWIDTIAGDTLGASVSNDLEHMDNILFALRKALGVRGLGEIFTVMGSFTLLLLLAFWGKVNRRAISRKLDLPLLLFIISLVAHALLSSEIARMLFLGGVVWAVILGLVLEKHSFLSPFRVLIGQDGIKENIDAPSSF